MFKISDIYANPSDAVLIKRSNPLLGQISYNLTSLDFLYTVKQGLIPMNSTSSGMVRLLFDNLMVGNYRLYINLPYNVSFINFIIDSNSTNISATYSSSFRVLTSNTNIQSIKDTITMFFTPRSIYNKTLFWNTTDYIQLSQQLSCYIISDTGYYIPMVFANITVNNSY